MSLPNEPFKVFLSHSEQDAELTRWVYEVLCRLHIRSFVYEYYKVGGANRFEKIPEMIRSTRYFVALLTRNGLDSQWVNQEIGYAVGVGKEPIPILEVNPETGERLKSRGFVEIRDPILHNPYEPGLTIWDLVYTLYAWLLDQNAWRDRMWLTCKCGHEFDADLGYERILAKPDAQSTTWDCPQCGGALEVGLPGFELRFLD